MVRFTFTPRGVAGVFLRQRAPGCGQRDQEALGDIIEDAFHQGIYAALEKAKKVYQEIHSGGCLILSKGDNCECFLCRIDGLAAKVKLTPGETPDDKADCKE